jgi:hypothetical protein
MPHTAGDVHGPPDVAVYTGPKDSTRISAVDILDKELLDYVRRLTLFSQEDTIPIESLVDPYDAR